MVDEIDDPFELMLSDLFAKYGKQDFPELTLERRASLRKLFPTANQSVPTLNLLWKRVANHVGETLEILSMIHMTLTGSEPVLMRDGDEDETPQLNSVSLAVLDGELRALLFPSENRRVRIALSVRGDVASRNDLSVELTAGDRLIEARPMEQKAEVVLDGCGDFTVTLFSGDKALGSMKLDINEVKASDND